MKPIKDKYNSFGWEVFETDGHSVEELDKLLTQAKSSKGKPKVIIIAHTIKCKGVSFMENNVDCYGKAPSLEKLKQQAIKEIEKQ